MKEEMEQEIDTENEIINNIIIPFVKKLRYSDWELLKNAVDRYMNRKTNEIMLDDTKLLEECIKEEIKSSYIKGL